MIGMNWKAAHGQFFDRARVQRSMDAATHRALSRFGAFVRRRAMSSIRTRKSISRPGSPPSSHTGLLKKFIYFVVEGTSNVVIGPVLLNKPSPTTLKALEHGGPSLVMRRGRRQKTLIRARPFMRPAFDLEINQAAHQWLNSIR